MNTDKHGSVLEEETYQSAISPSPSVSIRVYPWLLLFSLLLQSGVLASNDVERPFMLWTRAEIEKIGAKVQSEPWAKERVDSMRRAAPNPKDRAILDNYFLHLVTGDKEAGEYERKVLKHLGILLESPDYEEGRSIDISAFKNPTIANYDMAFRYDLFMDVLSPKEKHKLEERFNQWVYNQSGTGAAENAPGDWESPLAAYNAMVSVALGEKRLIEAVFKSPSGPKAYLDRMVDGYFSPKGNRPDAPCIGALWLWCRGVERLGLNHLGFGYVGTTGGTLRKLMEGYYVAGDPRVDIPGGTPFYGQSALTLSQGLGRRGFFDVTPSYLIPAAQSAASSTGVVAMVVSRLQHPRDVFRAPIVIGRMRDGAGEWPLLIPFKSDSFYGYDKSPRDLVGKPQIDYKAGARPNALGMQLPLFFELAHQRWPDARFDYFLAHMAPPASDVYYPSLYWGLDPIPLTRTKPPPVASMILPHCGMALLRSVEGEGFWDSPAPYAVLRLAEGKGDETAPSALSLHSLQAFNRPIYRHRGLSYGTDAGLTHNTVVVDNDPRLGTGKGSLRTRFDASVKFVGIRSIPYAYKEWVPGDQALTSNLVDKISGLRPGVEAERALALTHEYLLDVFRVAADTEHAYHWVVHSLGSAQPDAGTQWMPTESLNETLNFTTKHKLDTSDQRGFEYTLTLGFGDQQCLAPKGDPWSLNLVQTTTAGDATNTVMGAEWYDRKVGVRVTMLGEQGTTPFFTRGIYGRRLTQEETKRIDEIRFPKRVKQKDANYDKMDSEATEIPILPAGSRPASGQTPASDGKDFKVVGESVPAPVPETGGVSLIVRRRAAKTTFVALHQPFEKLAPGIEEFRRIQQTDDAVAVAILGKGVNDRVMVRQGEHADESITLGDGREKFVFKGFAYVRIGSDKVTVVGDILEMVLQTQGNPILIVNGKESKADIKDGVLSLKQ